MTSNCCSAEILSPDAQGHGRCANCKENCVPEDREPTETKVAIDGVINKVLTEVVLTKFAIKVLSTINQNNLLTAGKTQEIEGKKLAKLIHDFFLEGTTHG